MIKKIISMGLLLGSVILAFVIFKDSELPHNKKHLIETNFVQLEIDKYPLFEKIFLIAYNEKNSKIYGINRDSRDIYQITLDKSYKNPIVKKFISLPNNTSIENVFILDISFDNNKIYVSAVNEKSKKNECYFVLLYEYDLNSNIWKEIFKSTPCIRKVGFHDIGGKITHNSESIFLAGGNIFTNELNPYNYKDQDIIPAYKELIGATNFFGSVIQINKKTNTSNIISQGHRTPGGLFWDQSRNILWETEHGPRGGDELNIIKKGKNYGWPNVTYGKTYQRKTPSIFSTKYNSHHKFQKPFFSWTPSIGISDLGIISPVGNFSRHWNSNDLIISSLKDKSLYRNHIEGQKIIYSEKIYIGERLRSLVVAENVIFLSSDIGNLIVIKTNEDSFIGGPFPSTE